MSYTNTNPPTGLLKQEIGDKFPRAVVTTDLEYQSGIAQKSRRIEGAQEWRLCKCSRKCLPLCCLAVEAVFWYTLKAKLPPQIWDSSSLHFMLHSSSEIWQLPSNALPQKHWLAHSVPAMLYPLLLQYSIHSDVVAPGWPSQANVIPLRTRADESSE